jgi:hypothetical protein
VLIDRIERVNEGVRLLRLVPEKRPEEGGSGLKVCVCFY